MLVVVFRTFDDQISVFHAVFLTGHGQDRARIVALERRGPVPELLLVDNTDGLSALASKYIALATGDKRSALLSWCSENETLDPKLLPGFLNCVKEKLVLLLRTAEDKKRVLGIIELVDRCLEYQTVNTSVKHIFGLLAVRSLPARETRKKVD